MEGTESGGFDTDYTDYGRGGFNTKGAKGFYQERGRRKVVGCLVTEVPGCFVTLVGGGRQTTRGH